MAEELLVELKRSENSGFGFSLLGQQGLPHIIYAISEDSPAAESGKVQVGDVILKVNETDVINFNTKEVLKCLRLSSDPVTLKIKRDPNVKATFQKQLLSSGGDDGDVITLHHPRAGSNNYNQGRPEPAVHRTNGSCPEQQPLLAQENDRLYWQPLEEKPKAPKFEAFMMTGDKMLNISKTQQSILPKQQLKKVDHARFHNSHAHHLRHQQHNSVPNSPNEMDMGLRGNHRSSGPNSANTSPISANKRDSNPSPSDKTFNNFVRTSRSEDQLQDTKSMSAVDIDVDDDITSSLNTLLDTRPDAGSSSNVCTSSNSDRIVWTYNAPVTTSAEQNKLCQTLSNGSSSSPTSSSPLRSTSPQSPTSVSSSVMSSHSGSARKLPYTLTNGPHTDSGQYNQTNGGDFSVSEAISNISSPDYHDDDSMGIRDYVMEISDHSDSDSTLLVSEPRQRLGSDGDHRIVIQVKGPDKEQQSTVKDRGKQSSNKTNNKDQPTFDQQTCYYGMELTDVVEDVWPPASEDDSDLESLHSFHLTPKAVDMPSAIRLANRLYNLDGFKKSDVSRHLSKNNEFSRAVADEYLKNFNFYKDILDFALRKFLKQFSLTGETQERERVLVHFSKRYLDCNPGSFNSQDAVHTLTCAIMLLNTDLHGQSMSRKMTCSEFIENLAGLNEGENFPKDVLKELYNAIKSNPLEWALDEENEDNVQMQLKPIDSNIGGNPFLDVPCLTNAIEYKKGYVMRKCCYETNGKRTPFHKRSWKMFHCTLRDLVLYLHKDENGFRKNQMSDNLHNAIRIHHALATKATDYTKKQYVFRLQTADQAEYLFQTSDLKELQSWIDTINFVCASFSAPPLEAAVGSQKKFQRPLLPCSHTKFNLREQLLDHEERVTRLERDLMEHQQMPPERGSKSLVIQNYKEREAYLSYELKRYKTYAYILRSRMAPQYQELGVSLVETAIGELDEATGGAVTYLDGGGTVVAPPIPDRPSPQTNRCIVHIKYFPKYESPIPTRKMVD